MSSYFRLNRLLSWIWDHANIYATVICARCFIYACAPRSLRRPWLERGKAKQRNDLLSMVSAEDLGGLQSSRCPCQPRRWRLLSQEQLVPAAPGPMQPPPALPLTPDPVLPALSRWETCGLQFGSRLRSGFSGETGLAWNIRGRVSPEWLRLEFEIHFGSIERWRGGLLYFSNVFILLNLIDNDYYVSPSIWWKTDVHIGVHQQGASLICPNFAYGPHLCFSIRLMYRQYEDCTSTFKTMLTIRKVLILKRIQCIEKEENYIDFGLIRFDLILLNTTSLIICMKSVEAWCILYRFWVQAAAQD